MGTEGGIFHLNTGGCKLLCAPMHCHGAKANCIFTVQVFFLDPLFAVLLKLQFVCLNDSMFSQRVLIFFTFSVSFENFLCHSNT